jgi:hypothetical protein
MRSVGSSQARMYNRCDSILPTRSRPRVELLKLRYLASLVLVLNEMVLVLEETASSTSTANAEYEYE